MALHDIAEALRRAEQVLSRRPSLGVHDDASATARWDGGLRSIATHANGTSAPTDMPRELGGGGEHVTPGWLFRAGIASCVATRIAMAAAAEGIELGALEVVASSRSDTRGIFAMTGADGATVPAGPLELCLAVRISAAGVPAARLRELVEASNRCSPISCAVAEPVPLKLSIEVGTD
jgi:uncharacterized OsmC-like protein